MIKQNLASKTPESEERWEWDSTVALELGKLYKVHFQVHAYIVILITFLPVELEGGKAP